MTAHFSKVPHWLLAKVADGSLIPNALITYVAVAKYVNHRTGRGAWPANRTLRADTGFSERTVREHLAALEECGAVQRIARHSEHGRQTTNLVILIDEEPVEAPRRAVAPPGEQSPPPASGLRNHEADLSQTGGHSPPPPGEQSPPYELDPVTNQRVPTSPISAAAGSPVRTEVTSGSMDGSDGLSRTRDARPFPTVEQRKLVGWFGVTDPAAAEAWEASWRAAEGIAISHAELDYDPQDHLAIYLSRCREERRRPQSSRWLGFFIEDRAKHIQVLREEAEQIDHHHETPQEREDRLNRPLPPADWGIPPAAAETGDEQ